MADEVKKDAGSASGQEEVKKDAAQASEADVKKELDLAVLLASTLEKLEKTEKDRDNYKEGMLIAKGKKDAGDDENETKGNDTKVLAETLDVVKTLIRRNQELETAVLNKSQMSNTGQGGGSSDNQNKVGDNVLSQSQIDALKARGFDDKKIARFKENLQKARAF